MTNIKYVEGGHGAALAAKNWDEMAAFVLNGAIPRAAHAVAAQNANVALLGRLAPLVWLLLVLVILGIGALLLWAAGTTRLDLRHPVRLLSDPRACRPDKSLSLPPVARTLASSRVQPVAPRHR
jgi:hypothetical protein